MTATEAARRFSELLDAIEHDRESFRVSRNGRVVARIEPAVPANGAEIKEILRARPADPEWWRDIIETRALLEIEERDWQD